jgi:hypothetical protein
MMVDEIASGAFDVLCAVGYRAGKPRLWAAETFPLRPFRQLSRVSRVAAGEPRRIVCDAYDGMPQAIEARWREPELQSREWACSTRAGTPTFAPPNASSTS